MLRQRRPALAAEAEAAEDACGGGSRAAWMDKLDDCVPHPSVAGDGRHGWWWWTRRQSGAHLLLCESNGVDGFEAHIDSHGRRGTHLLLACVPQGAARAWDMTSERHATTRISGRGGAARRSASPRLQGAAAEAAAEAAARREPGHDEQMKLGTAKRACAWPQVHAACRVASRRPARLRALLHAHAACTRARAFEAAPGWLRHGPSVAAQPAGRRRRRTPRRDALVVTQATPRCRELVCATQGPSAHAAPPHASR